MIKISTHFDVRKFERDLERQIRETAEKQVRARLRDLTARGLRIRISDSGSTKFNFSFEGPADLVAEAKKRLC